MIKLIEALKIFEAFADDEQGPIKKIEELAKGQFFRAKQAESAYENASHMAVANFLLAATCELKKGIESRCSNS
jgi:hypothetical protein